MDGTTSQMKKSSGKSSYLLGINAIFDTEDDFSKVYLKYYDYLYYYGLRYTNNEQIIEDCIQNLFVSLMRHPDRIGQIVNLSVYLTSSYRRELKKSLAKTKRTLVSDEIDDDHFNFFGHNPIDVSDSEKRELMHSILNRHIANLTAHQQEILFLRYQSGLPYEEIASIFNITVDSCYKSIHRIIHTLKEAIEKSGVDINPEIFFVFFKKIM